MNTSPVRVGIIGLGRSGWSIHALGLQQMPERYQIVAVADLITERRAEAQQTLGCRAYAGYGELLADREVELVIVAPPSTLHSVYTIAALQAGKAVVCEKPMIGQVATLPHLPYFFGGRGVAHGNVSKSLRRPIHDHTPLPDPPRRDGPHRRRPLRRFDRRGAL